MRGCFIGKAVIGTLMDSPGAACSTATEGGKSTFKGQEEKYAPIAPCPSCGVAVAQKRVGGSMRRFCSDGCRWSWHRGERRRRLIEAIEVAACQMCCDPVLKAVGLGSLERQGGGMGP